MQLGGDEGIGADQVCAGGDIVRVDVDDGVGVLFVGQSGVGEFYLAGEELGAEAAVVDKGAVFGESF